MVGRKGIEKTKRKHRKGLWSPEEDQKLRDYILRHGHGCWSSVPTNTGLQRNGKSCRLRWINYLRPGLKRGMFTAQEVHTILTLHRSLGNKWSQIAQHLPGRTDNEIKNYWHSYLKKNANKQNQETPNNSGNIEETVGNGAPSNQTHDHSQASFLPKIWFAEWLPQDNSIIIEGTSADQYDSLPPISCIENDLNPQNSYLPTIHGGTLSGEYNSDRSYGTASEIRRSLFEFEDRISGSGFARCISVDNICRDFSMSEDFLYI